MTPTHPPASRWTPPLAFGVDRRPQEATTRACAYWDIHRSRPGQTYRDQY